jgi:hypothetical protein
MVTDLTVVRDVKKLGSGSQKREEVVVPTACISRRHRQRQHFLSDETYGRRSDSLPKVQRPIASFTSAVGDPARHRPLTTRKREVSHWISKGNLGIWPAFLWCLS